VSVDPVWQLKDADDRIVASTKAPTALDARELFKREGQQGVRVVRAEVAPVQGSEHRRGPVCEICDQPIDTQRDYRLVTGWERITRSAGGTNAIRVPDRTAQRFACMFCIDKLANGVSPHQQTLT
jgi:hypothetical protein